MVWNRRHTLLFNKQKFAPDKVAPYFLHIMMVIAVAAYVLLGAFAIRSIEATAVVKKQDTEHVFMTKNERLEHAREQLLQRVSNDSTGSAEAVEGRRVKRVAVRSDKLARSRQCVKAALRQIAHQSKCHKDMLKTNVMAQLDDCYVEDLRRVVRRAQEPPVEAAESVTPQAAEDNVEWVYWPMNDAVLFCFTVITTIGYGNVAPQTFYGQLFVIVYGLFGVPFSMMVIANLGKFMAELLKRWTKPFAIIGRQIYRRCIRKKKTDQVQLVTKETGSKDVEATGDSDSDKNNNGSSVKRVTFEDTASDDLQAVEEGGTAEEDEEGLGEGEDDETNVHQDTASLFIAFVLYVVIGSVIISSYEPEMDVFKAIYYTFVSLTTIGLGDVVPKSQSYLVFTLIYIAVGLALTTIAIEIASDYLKKLHYFGRKMENVGNVQIWFGGKKLSMKQLVKNLGDQFNLPVSELETLNLDKFVDDAIKVEQGELASLRNSQYPYGIKPIFITDFKGCVDSSAIFADEDERYIVYAYKKGNHYTDPNGNILPPPPDLPPPVDSNGNIVDGEGNDDDAA